MEYRCIAVVNGPNLNLLGTREPGIYGAKTLDQVNAELASEALKLQVTLDFFKANAEGAIVDHLQACIGRVEGGVHSEFRTPGLFQPVLESVPALLPQT